MPEISIIIPVRQGGNPYTTLRSLAKLAPGSPSFEIIVSHDSQAQGANWARNRGAALARAELLLFSDDDIEWSPVALLDLDAALSRNPLASYSYGSYLMAGRIQCNIPWSPERLRRGNFVSTMSLIRAAHFTGFDESIYRLQDWDLWLTMLAAGRTGVSCENLIFTTERKPGITVDGPIGWKEARDLVAAKHGL